MKMLKPPSLRSTLWAAATQRRGRRWEQTCERSLIVFVCTKYSFMVELQSAARMSERESKFEVYNSGYNLLQRFSKYETSGHAEFHSL